MNNGELSPSTRAIYAVFDFFGQYYRRIIAGVIALVVLSFLGSGLTIIKKEQQGVRTLFGKVVETDIGPGLHYAIPTIEQLYVRNIKRIVGHQIASQSEGVSNFTLLSGDTNLLEIDLSVHYRIDNLRPYLFASSDPLKIATLVLRERLINIMGQNFIDLILTFNRNIIEQRLFREATDYLEQVDVGIELIALSIVEVRPIEETIFAFRDVNNAIEERSQAVSNANRIRERLIARSKGQAEALVMMAQATAQERVAQAKSGADAFQALLAEYQKDPAQVAVTQYWKRMRTVFTEASLAAVNPGNESTIDINMIDGAVPVPPVQVALGEPPSSDAGVAEYRRTASTAMPKIHTKETLDLDRPLISGRFHRKRAERHHVWASNPRSLIFDTPAIFSHSHGAVDAEESKKSMSEQIHEGGQDGRSSKEKGHSEQAPPSGHTEPEGEKPVAMDPPADSADYAKPEHETKK